MNANFTIKLRRTELVCIMGFLSAHTHKHSLVSVEVGLNKLAINIAGKVALAFANKLVMNPMKREFSITLNEDKAIAVWHMLLNYHFGFSDYENVVLNDLLTKLDQHLAC